MSVHTEHGDKAHLTLSSSTLLQFRRISSKQALSKQAQRVMKHAEIAQVITSLGGFLFCCCVRERLTGSGDSEPEETSPSSSWQDSARFLCLSRKCKKSDFRVFHLHTHRTSSICLVGCLVHCAGIYRRHVCQLVSLPGSVSHIAQQTQNTLQPPALHKSKVFCTFAPGLADIVPPLLLLHLPSPRTFLHASNFLSVPERLLPHKNMFYSSEKTENPS